jgi:hypothetical protein
MEEKTISQFNIDELKQVLYKLNSLDNQFLVTASKNEKIFEETISTITNQLEKVINTLDNK